ncbi:pirin family protein [Salinarimonas rosea]|uniref:pirin family protein n=1 Tax=Salinarimonas rosea TaxID=552063 RepID=UPI0004261BF4|nr:pirin family protein [Salinarimonas rosea]
MSTEHADDPVPGDPHSCDAIETVIVPRARDIGSFEVRRALPSARKQMVGPFIFFDQMGPAEFLLGAGMDVRPHPHIGLATVTYLFDGEIVHRDSLGTELPIRPGALNLMTAGRGITHSERTSADLRTTGSKLFGIQSWVALAERDEEGDPGFVHYGADALPIVEGEGKSVRLVAGAALGARSPVRTSTETIYADAALEAGAVVPFDTDWEERAIYTVSGEVEIAGDRFGPGRLLVFRPGDRIAIRAATPARFMMLGGEPMDGPRYIWWNFVSSRRERIEEAKNDWRAGRFAMVPGETEFIPLPGR